MDNRENPERRRTSKSDGSGIMGVLAFLFAVIAILIIIQACIRIIGQENPAPDPSNPSLLDSTPGNTDPLDGSTPEITTPADTTPGETTPAEKSHVVSTASVGVTGDILMHGPVINAGQSAAGKAGEYDFTSMFQYIKPYYEQYDLMIANLEVTLGGPEAGEYKGYPTFNCPDDIVDSLMGAGVDMLLTANNHSYDTGINGFTRTQEVLNSKGMLHLGTQLNADDADYMVREINGIKVGMICYTYETTGERTDRKYLNGILLSEKAGPLVTSFSYDRLDSFYTELAENMKAMEEEGAEATIVFIHWGNEYQLDPTSSQKKIAQKLCDMGVDVIVGGHPHVIEPFTTLTSDNGNTAYCIYSVGNALSNQNRVSLETSPNKQYTEDGMIFGVTFQKWNDGTVEVAEIEILPTWVNKEWRTDRNIYAIIPLDTAVATWNGYDVTNQSRLQESYNRTMSLVGEGLNLCREDLGLEAVITTVNDK